MIPKEVWLPKAQRLSIGRTIRVQHLNERRPNLVIGNAVDKWWCYCQACKQGGVLEKTHVRLDVSPEARRSNLTMPEDLKLLENCDPNVQAPIMMFLHSKGMDPAYLPPVLYSHSRKRILIQHTKYWLGRDLTGQALEKWLTYNGAQFLWNNQFCCTAVVVEDPFSFYKVSHACPTLDVYCALGTQIKDVLVRKLMQGYDKVLWMFDGDDAGRIGAVTGHQRLSTHGVRCYNKNAPWGMDPKDMTLQQIRSYLLGESDG